MTTIPIDRELLERLACEVVPTTHQELLNASDDFGAAIKELRAILAAPRQPEGEGLEVVGLQWLDSGHYRKKPPKYGFNPHDWNELCRLSDHQRAIAELREECERLRSECARLESKYERDVWGLNNEGDPIGGDSPSGFANDLLRVTIERDSLRQQLAERDATIERLEAGIPRIQEQSHQMRQVRDKLEGLLRDLWEYTHDPELEQRIEAALAEVKPCQESLHPAAT